MNDVIALEQLFTVFTGKIDENLNKRRKVVEHPEMIDDYIKLK